MLNGRTLLLVLLAVLLALGAGWLANRWLQNQAGHTAGTQVATQPVVAVALTIPYGGRIEAQHVKLVQMPKELVPKGAFTATAEVVGKIAKHEMTPGELLLPGEISEQPEGSVLAALLSPNKRAITVRVDDVIGVGGFLLPSSYVDVLSTRHEGSERRSSTETVLQRIKVLAVDQRSTNGEKDPVVVRSVTLEVDPEQAERLIKAEAEGSIQLTLRNPGDESISTAVGQPAAPVVVAKPVYRPTRPVVPSTVTVIRGVKTETSNVR